MFWTYRWRLNSGKIVRTNMKQLCGFAVSHIVTHYYAASHRVVCSVRRSFCRSVNVTLVNPAKNSWNDQVTICVPDSGGPNEPRITWARCQHGKGQFWGGNRQTIVNYRDTPQSSGQRQLNRSRCRFGCGLAWAKSITCYMRGPDSPWEGAILVYRRAHCKV